MKKFSKFIATVAALALGLSVSMTAFAAPSKTTTSNNNNNTVTATTSDGKTVTVNAVTDAKVNEAKTAAVQMVNADATVMKVFDLSVSLSGPTDITMNVPGVTAGQNIAVLHQKADGKWESLKVVKVENGKVTATFTSTSPVAIVAKGKLAPKTGVVVSSSGIVALLSLVGAAICFKKVKRA